MLAPLSMHMQHRLSSSQHTPVANSRHLSKIKGYLYRYVVMHTTANAREILKLCARLTYTF